MTLTLMCHF